MSREFTRAMSRYLRAKSDCDRTQGEIAKLLEWQVEEPVLLRDLARIEGLKLQRNNAFDELRSAEDALFEAALEDRRRSKETA